MVPSQSASRGFLSSTSPMHLACARSRAGAVKPIFDTMIPLSNWASCTVRAKSETWSTGTRAFHHLHEIAVRYERSPTVCFVRTSTCRGTPPATGTVHLRPEHSTVTPSARPSAS